jgi:acyl dehydratase
MKIKKGDTFSTEEEVDKYRAVIYAGASGDFNPIHIDPEVAKAVGLGGVILHGLCTLGFAAKAVTDWTNDPGKLKKIKCRFSSPVRPEDKVTVRGEVSDIKEKRASVEMKVTTGEGVEALTMVSAEVEAE